MNVVIPMAGRGSRFKTQGYTVPKAMIDVLGMPMYVRAVNSLPLELATQLIFICLEEIAEYPDFHASLDEYYGEYDPVIIEIEQTTEGQACTVLLARDYIDNDEPLIIHNVDTAFAADTATLLRNLGGDIDGVISVFEAEGTRWSYVALDENGIATEVAEKRPVSQWATTGMYHFTRGSDFVSGADYIVAHNIRENNEFYVSTVYSQLISRGKRFIIDAATDVWPLGTPEDLEESLIRMTNLP